MKKYVIYSILITLISCGISRKKVDLENKESVAFQQGLALMKEEEYQKAEAHWGEFLKKYPVTSLSASAYYLRARSLEKTNRCEQAIPLYKSAIIMWGVSPSKDKARAYLRIASCYNQQDKSDLAIAELISLEKYRKYLKWEDYFIERNAQLAIAYAKEENNEQAKKYFSQVDKHIRQALQSSKKISPSWMADLFFQLSDNIKFSKNMNSNFLSLSAKQSYMVKIIEWNLGSQSVEAFEKIKKAYQEIEQFIFIKKAFKDEVEKKDFLEKKEAYVNKLIVSLNELNLEFSPAVEESALIRQVKNWIDLEIQKKQSYLATIPDDGGLTPSSQERQSIKQKGRSVPVKPVKDPNL